jgi:hypothetical protein
VEQKLLVLFRRGDSPPHHHRRPLVSSPLVLAPSSRRSLEETGVSSF